MIEENKQKMIEGFTHLCKCIDWGKSFLDAEAITFMNEWRKYLE